jgi:D-3-phosphoglycerate dehydrogenase
MFISMLLLRKSNRTASYKKSCAPMKILIADSMHNSLFEMLERQNWEYAYHPEFTRADIMSSISGYEGLIIRSKTNVDKEILTHASNLRFIARAGAGLDLIDLEVARQKGITIFHAGEGNRDAVAEHAVGMLLGLFNNILKADREVRSGIWDREGNRGVELMNKTVGIVGYGNNGSATATRLGGFGCKVLAYDRYKVDYGNEFVEQASLDEIMAQADVLSLHVPLTEYTRYLVDRTFIENFARPFYLMNVSRGEIVRLEAVVEGIKSGKILGACLDVLENEKIKALTPEQQNTFDFLAGSDRVVLTPHIAGWTHESYRRINEVLVQQISGWCLNAE